VNVSRLPLEDLVVFEPELISDERGWFTEMFREDLFVKYCGEYKFVQENQSWSVANVLRGLHYQVGKPQGKLIRVARGEIYDVVVDMRVNSNTFGEWCGIVLSQYNKLSLWIPPGFAHGFHVKYYDAIVSYKTTEYYSPEGDRTLLWNDPYLDIDWQLRTMPMVSEKDQRGKTFREAEKL